MVPDISIHPTNAQDIGLHLTAVCEDAGLYHARSLAARAHMTCLRPPLVSIKAANNFSKQTLNEARLVAGSLTPARWAAPGRCCGGHEHAGGFSGGN